MSFLHGIQGEEEQVGARQGWNYIQPVPAKEPALPQPPGLLTDSAAGLAVERDTFILTTNTDVDHSVEVLACHPSMGRQRQEGQVFRVSHSHS